MFTQSTNENKKAYTVSELNNLARDFLEHNPYLNDIKVEGEITNFSTYPYGVFFTIVDDTCRLDGFISSAALYRSYQPKKGDKVIITGGLTIFPKNGKYQIKATKIEQSGVGDELLKLLQLAEKLKSEGLFDESKKRPIPKFPKNIGVVAGKDSAALADIIKNVYRRYPLVTLNIHPSLVQGEKAPKDLIKNLDMAYHEDNDVIIIARGGGSKEDLSAFNDEMLVRMVAKSPCPIIAAIGHEIDFSLVDFASDMRVSTPTAAAEAATPNIDHIIDDILYYDSSINENIRRYLLNIEKDFNNISSRPIFQKPTAIYDIYEEKLDSYTNSILKSYNYYISNISNKINNLENVIKHLNPNNVLERGYSLSFDKNGKVVKSINDINIGEEIQTKFKDGLIISEIKEKVS